MTQNTTAVLSYAIYMANAWSPNEATTIFGPVLGKHIFDKWVSYIDVHGMHGASMKLVYELDEMNLDKLVNRACELYEGRKNK